MLCEDTTRGERNIPITYTEKTIVHVEKPSHMQKTIAHAEKI